MRKIRVVDVSKQEPTPSARRPEVGSDVWMAIDLSRTKLVYCLRWNGMEQRRLSTPLGLDHVRAVVEQYRGCRLHVAYEACGFGYELAWWLQEQRVAVTVIAPSRIERAPGKGVKTDRIDAGSLARKLEKGDLKGIYVPTRLIHEQRQLGRTYAQCVKERSRAQVRIRSLLQEQGRIGPSAGEGWAAYSRWLRAQPLPESIGWCVRILEEMRTLADRKAKELRAELLKVARSEAYKPLVEALCKQPGVGAPSAIRFALELADVSRFPTTDSLPHYLGVTPSEYSSGELQHRGRILKCGPGALRALLLQCAWSAVRKGRDPDLRKVFDRLAPRTGRKRAIVAVARRLAIKLRRRWLEMLGPALAA